MNKLEYNYLLNLEYNYLKNNSKSITNLFKIKYQSFKRFCTRKYTYKKYITIFEFDYLDLIIKILPILKINAINKPNIENSVILEVIKNNQIIFKNKDSKQINKIINLNNKIIKKSKLTHLHSNLSTNILNTNFYKILNDISNV